jgi:hypothetical protein
VKQSVFFPLSVDLTDEEREEADDEREKAAPRKSSQLRRRN